MKKVTGLNTLYQLGYMIVQFRQALASPQAIYADVAQQSAIVWTQLQTLLRDVPVPLESTRKVIVEFVDALDNYKNQFASAPGALIAGTIDAYRFNDLIVRLEALLAQELDAMPIWFVTARRAYSVDVLINNAEKIFDQDVISLLSARSVKDIREAGRAIAFELPTAAGFHSVRAVEGVARGYYAAIGGLRPTDDSPLGPVTNEIRKTRDTLLSAGTIDKEDLIHIVIEMLARLNNIYRKPITHPDMILDLSAAMNVFDSAKCSIELMLEDAKKKHSSSPIPSGFF